MDDRSTFITQCHEANVHVVASVPDGYLVPLIRDLDNDNRIRHIAAAREEECLGIAAGVAMAGRRAVVLVQNVGFLNSLGCYATLCVNYKTPFLIVVSHRGNFYDKNRYDVLKYQYFNAVNSAINPFAVSWRDFRGEAGLVSNLLERAEVAQEPALLLLDMPPDGL
ncbi:MAG: thiamine pyrophosphate-binding protein [Pseudomonadales bacterium]